MILLSNQPAGLSAWVHLRSYRLLIFLTSGLLATVAFPASKAKVLVPNDDSLCILFAVGLFGSVALSSLVVKKRLRMLFALFLTALVLQAWAIHWVESGPFFELVLRKGTLSLRLWTGIYLLSWAELIVVAVARWHSARSSPPRQS